MRKILILCALFCAFSLTAQDTIRQVSEVKQDSCETVKKRETKIFEKPEVFPEYKGGQDALFRDLARTVKYPEIARLQGIQGRVVVQFILHEDCKITDVVVLRGVHPSLDAEAIRVVKQLTYNKPAMSNGKSVSMKMFIPITFRLNANMKK